MRLRRIAVHDFTLYLAAYFDHTHATNLYARFGVRALNSKNKVVDEIVHEGPNDPSLDPPTASSNDLRLLRYALFMIDQFMYENEEQCTFCVVHNIPKAVRIALDLNAVLSDPLAREVREKFYALPSRVWITFSAGQSRRSDEHLRALRQLILDPDAA